MALLISASLKSSFRLIGRSNVETNLYTKSFNLLNPQSLSCMSEGPFSASSTHIPTLQRCSISSLKGIPQKPNPISWPSRLKEFFKPTLTIPTPQAMPSLRFSRDHRSLTNEEWQTLGIHNSVRIFMRFHGLVPDLFPKAFTPSINLVVSYGESSWDLVYRGNYLSSLQSLTQPQVRIPSDGLNPQASYTLLFVGLDEPHKGHKSHLHQLYWLVKDIPGADPRLEAGHEVLSYQAPLPLKNSGEHRYAFILAEQTQAVQLPEKVGDNFCGASFLRQHRLMPRGLCFFQSEYDPELAKVYQERGVPQPFLETSTHIKTRLYQRLRSEEISSYSKHQESS